MRIYCILENRGEEYFKMFVPTKISAKPFDNDCYYIDIDEMSVFNTIDDEEGESDWKPYNTIIREWGSLDTKTNKFIPISQDNSEFRRKDGFLFDWVKNVYQNKVYHNGTLINTYFG